MATSQIIYGSLSATTISGSTLYGDGSNLTGISGGGSFTGGTVNGSTTFTNTVSANTISATTLYVSGNSITQPYKVYTAIISQLGTNNPTVVAVLQNNIGTITITRDTQGIYNFASPLFIGANNKVFVSITNGQSLTGLYRGQYVPPLSAVQITTLNPENAATDGILDNASIEIRLYN